MVDLGILYRSIGVLRSMISLGKGQWGLSWNICIADTTRIGFLEMQTYTFSQMSEPGFGEGREVVIQLYWGG